MGVASWAALHLVAKPILALRAQRLEAMRIAERYAYFGPMEPDERVRTVRREIFDAASNLVVHARGGSKLVRLYCKMMGYDLEAAAGALRGIGEMAGAQFSEETRMNTLSHVYISLGAGHHLSSEARQQHQAAINDSN